MEKSIALEEAPEAAKGCGTPASASASASASAPQKSRLPSARDTAARRDRMAAFINGMDDAAGTGGIAEACRRMAAKWFDRHRRLLI
jgi:hypothetical protein